MENIQIPKNAINAINAINAQNAQNAQIAIQKIDKKNFILNKDGHVIGVNATISKSKKDSVMGYF